MCIDSLHILIYVRAQIQEYVCSHAHNIFTDTHTCKPTEVHTPSYLIIKYTHALPMENLDTPCFLYMVDVHMHRYYTYTGTCSCSITSVCARTDVHMYIVHTYR